MRFEDNSKAFERSMVGALERLIETHTKRVERAATTSLNRTASALGGPRRRKRDNPRPDGLPGPPLKRTGTLQRELTSDVARTRSEVFGRVGYRRGTPAQYAQWLETGTRRMPAYPFLRPALDANASRLRFELRQLGGRIR